jgi:hypothetical protein
MRQMPVLLLCLSLSAYAEKPFDTNIENTTLLNPACPLTLTGIFADKPGHKETRVSVHFVNQTDKRVIAVKLGLLGLDATRDPHEFPEEYALSVNLRPEKEAKPVWVVAEDEFGVNTASGARVYLGKLMFADGSMWRDDGSRSCSLTIFGRARPSGKDE